MDRLRLLADRLRAADPLRVDVAIAVVLGLLMALELGFSADLERPAATFSLIPLFVAPIPFRRRAPIAALGAVAAGLLLGAILGTSVDDGFMSFLAVILLVWSVGARVDDGRVVVGVATGLLGVIVAAVLIENGRVALADVLWAGVVALLLPLAGARLLRSNARLAALMAERARSLEAERDERARLAAAEERERIAAELHDVVAHGVSAMVVQAAAARRLVAAGADPDDSRKAIAAVESSGRAALDELRRLLGVLRRGDESLALAPQPSLARLDRLVARMRAEGLPVELEVDGEPRPLPAGLDVTAYRIVEEALADVLRQGGPVPTRVSVRHRPRELELEVVDAGGARMRSADRDDGLGLRERVALFGGSLHAGRRRGGGWQMRARLPIEREAA